MSSSKVLAIISSDKVKMPAALNFAVLARAIRISTATSVMGGGKKKSSG